MSANAGSRSLLLLSVSVLAVARSLSVCLSVLLLYSCIVTKQQKSSSVFFLDLVTHFAVLKSIQRYTTTTGISQRGRYTVQFRPISRYFMEMLQKGLLLLWNIRNGSFLMNLSDLEMSFHHQDSSPENYLEKCCTVVCDFLFSAPTFLCGAAKF